MGLSQSPGHNINISLRKMTSHNLQPHSLFCAIYRNNDSVQIIYFSSVGISIKITIETHRPRYFSLQFNGNPYCDRDEFSALPPSHLEQCSSRIQTPSQGQDQRRSSRFVEVDMEQKLGVVELPVLNLPGDSNTETVFCISSTLKWL